VIDPIALDELLPDWRDDGCPLAEVPVTKNHHWILTAGKHRSVPHAGPALHAQQGHLYGKSRQSVPLAGGQGRGTGRRIFPGFAAAEVLFHEDGG
jgi:electron-transferring-flavoprotein dehydrogenase